MPAAALSPKKTLRQPAQARAVKTRRAIVTAAQREFSRRGYAATTAKSIADRARVATGSFYQYFTNKDEVLRELAAERAAWIGDATVGLLERLSDAAPPEGARQARALVREAMARVVAAVMHLHAEDRGLHAVLTERRHADPDLDALTSEREAALVSRIADLLRRWNHPGDPDATAFVLFGALEGSVHAHVLGRPHVSDERFVAALVDSLMQIVLPSKE